MEPGFSYLRQDPKANSYHLFNDRGGRDGPKEQQEAEVRLAQADLDHRGDMRTVALGALS
jgi:hypothetical protein